MDDIGILALENSYDLFRKLEREYKKLVENQNSDNYYNFIMTANHLPEWAMRDKVLPKNLKKNIKKIRKTEQYQLINDMACRGKHFTRDKKTRENPPAMDFYSPGFSYSQFTYSNFCYGEVHAAEFKGQPVNLLEECKVLFSLFGEVYSPKNSDLVF